MHVCKIIAKMRDVGNKQHLVFNCCCTRLSLVSCETPSTSSSWKLVLARQTLTNLTFPPNPCLQLVAVLKLSSCLFSVRVSYTSVDP